MTQKMTEKIKTETELELQINQFEILEIEELDRKLIETDEDNAKATIETDTNDDITTTETDENDIGTITYKEINAQARKYRNWEEYIKGRKNERDNESNSIEIENEINHVNNTS